MNENVAMCSHKFDPRSQHQFADMNFINYPESKSQFHPNLVTFIPVTTQHESAIASSIMLMFQKSCTMLRYEQFIPLLTGCYTSQVVQEFYHQQYAYFPGHFQRQTLRDDFASQAAAVAAAAAAAAPPTAAGGAATAGGAAKLLEVVVLLMGRISNPTS